MKNLDRRMMLRGGLAGLAALAIPAVPAVLGAQLGGYVGVAMGPPVNMTQHAWSVVIENHAKAAVGLAEKSGTFDTFKAVVNTARKEGIEVDYFYGTLTGERTNWISTIDELHWKIGDLPYTGLRDEKLCCGTAIRQHNFDLVTDTPVEKWPTDCKVWHATEATGHRFAS